MEIVFDTHDNERQKECVAAWLNPDILDIVYGGSKGSGKSYLGVSLIFGDALIYPGTFYFIARKKLNDLRKYTIPSIYEVFEHWGITKEYYTYNGQDNYFELYNGSRVYLIDAAYQPSDPEYARFGSMQMTRGWIEEAGEFHLDAKNNLQATVGRRKNDDYNLAPKVLMTCNPAKNFLFSEYYKKHKDKKLESWKCFIQALPKDNKMLPKGYLLNLERTLTTSQKKRLLWGLWEYDDDPSLLIDSYDAICDLFLNDHVLEGADNYLSTDLAMKGRDRWIAASWKGLVAKIDIDETYSKSKEMEVRLKALMIRKRIPRSHTVADSDGLGAYLGGYIEGIKEFHGGSRALNNLMYFNLKTECAFKLAELINKREIRVICTDEQAEILKQELGVLRQINLNVDTAPKRIISKEDMKGLLGWSPDYLDTLLMRMIYLLKPNAKGMRRVSIKPTK